MAHVREQIRKAIATAVTGLATTGANVSSSRVYPHDTLPSLVVLVDGDVVQTELGTMDRKQDRLLSVSVAARAKGTAAVDDTLDTICAEVEAALAADITLGGLAKDLWLSNTAIGFDGASDQPTGLATMSYSVEYRVAEGAPTVAIP